MTPITVTKNSNFDYMYQISLVLEKHQKGILLINRIVVSEEEYNLISNKIKNSYTLSFGDTAQGGTQLSTTIDSSSKIEDIISLIVLTGGDLVSVGLDKDDGEKPIPRTDLQYSYNNISVVIDKDLLTPFIKSMFKDIVYREDISKESHVNKLVNNNYKNIMDDIN